MVKKQQTKNEIVKKWSSNPKLLEKTENKLINKLISEIDHLNTLIIPQDIYCRLFSYVQLSDKEIAGLGKVEKVRDSYVLTDVALYHQLGKETYNTAITDDVMLKFFEDNKINFKDSENWLLQWHSHPTFGVSPSTIDIQNRENLLRGMFDKGLFSLIVNKNYEYNLTYSVRTTDKVEITKKSNWLKTINLNLPEFLNFDMKLYVDDIQIGQEEIKSIVEYASKDMEHFYSVVEDIPVDNPYYGLLFDKYRKEV